MKGLNFANMDLNKIERMDMLIRRNATGTPTAFAIKMGMSNRSLHNYINFMRVQLRAPIKYSSTMQSYHYTENGRFRIGWYADA